MSGMMDKAKDMASKVSGSSSGGSSESTSSSSGGNSAVHKGIDMATDKGE